jgi:diguanylate cyclase (GGDEF)-like protein
MMTPGMNTGRALRRSLLGMGTVSAMALVLALAAVLELLEPETAVEGCVALAVIAAASFALLRTGTSARFTDAAFVTGQMVAVYLLLGWLTYRAEDAPAALSVLYVVAFLYGVLQLERRRLAAVAAIALVAHGAALLLVIEHGHKINQAAAWTQFGALALALAWFTYAAGIVLRLRARLGDALGRLHDLAEEAKERASRDALTGAYHRNHVIDALEREIARAERVGKPLSVARVDLDRLAELNETHGHSVGDIALKRFTQAAGGALRDVDILGRYGGKEFLILMPDTALDGALIAVERVRGAVAGEPMPEVEGRRNLSCTAGVAEHRKGENTRLVLARAEAHLNLGKAGGRDRVVAEVR